MLPDRRSSLRRVEFAGEPILIEFRPCLRAWRGKLICGGERGDEVLAGSFLRERRIVLDAALLDDAGERDRILVHEIFHFVWWKLGPRLRAGYEELLRAEKARGELGWSAEWRKQQLRAEDWRRRTRRLKDYLCESFCDTAAAFLLEIPRHEEITLNARARLARRTWMEESLGGRRLKI
jgi:hypothetical protein